MNKDLKEALEQEALRELEELGRLDPCGEDAAEATSNVTSLLKAVNEADKIESEEHSTILRVSEECGSKETEAKGLKEQRLFNFIVGIGGVIGTCIGLGLQYKLTHDVLKFEETGYVASSAGKSVINSIRIKK